MELSAALEPDRPPKTDKATILNDAVRILAQLRSEAQGLQESNDQLRETIKDLKVGAVPGTVVSFAVSQCGVYSRCRAWL